MGIDTTSRTDLHEQGKGTPTGRQSLLAAHNGEAGPEQQRLAQLVIDVGALLLAKNKDYGGSAWKPPALCPMMAAGDAILVRMSDKVARLANLLTKTGSEVSESLDDTMRDLAGYAILYLARPKADGHCETTASA